MVARFLSISSFVDGFINWLDDELNSCFVHGLMNCFVDELTICWLVAGPISWSLDRSVGFMGWLLWI